MSRNKSTKFSKKSEHSDTGRLVLGTVIGCVSTILILTLLSFSASMVALNTENPDSLTLPFAYVITAVSLLFGGIIGARKAKELGICAGIATGVICTLLAFCLHLILTAQKGSGASSLLFLVYPFVSALGGYIGTPKPKKKSKFKSKF